MMTLTLRAVIENREANERGARETCVLYCAAALWASAHESPARALELAECALESAREAETFHALRTLGKGRDRGLFIGEGDL